MPPQYTFNSPPILLLKTKSFPHDSYEEYFSANYSPAFIPVLEHRFHDPNLQTIRHLFESGGLQPGPGRKYGGLIFTSQRAVEGFAALVATLDQNIAHSSSTHLILYTVGPATARSLTTLRDAHLPHATIHGADTGTGENLARYILAHYNSPSSDADASSQLLQEQQQQQRQQQQQQQQQQPPRKLPLLFLVGEQRRDVIPRMLMQEAGPDARIQVDELVVYETGVMEGFEEDFAAAVAGGEEFLAREAGGAVWVVVFSPTGCDAMVRVLDLNQGRGEANDEKGRNGRRVFVATIGPTTRDHLVKNMGFEPQVCAEKPSQEGVAEGIATFMKLWNMT
ncbi:hypothetical protein FE257_000621 [Aspergillus nanangensis]|uniref:Tetrapyrrole biosynthesis uroporphyrinogen III synthase domain-containing protein n=1 Tax=Aspergillus nanangensis TaxID=2582783 RepID=A0AAD4CF55_ASPNN|nr:hypothetical protein FE257_000621 [Aspergillus nanangensis]